MQYKTREMAENEFPQLKNFLYEAIFIPEGKEKPARDIVHNPDLAIYYQGFGRKGDTCFVAVIQGKIVGAIWIRLFSNEKPGYGFIDASIPELSMSVLKPWQNNGIGTHLLKTMMDFIYQSNFAKVSLSVDKANFAMKMYEKFGFKEITDHGKYITMLKSC